MGEPQWSTGFEQPCPLVWALCSVFVLLRRCIDSKRDEYIACTRLWPCTGNAPADNQTVQISPPAAAFAPLPVATLCSCLLPGIPKFYRWLSERYPLLNMSVAATEAPPEIDNLYLDMNGIIHNCTHANDPNLKLTETEMVVRIFTYLDKLIQIIKPQKLVFMAIDGAHGSG